MVSRWVEDGGNEVGTDVDIDVTDEQLEVAMRHRETRARAVDVSRPNVGLTKGYVEDLSAAGVEEESVDVGSTAL